MCLDKRKAREVAYVGYSRDFRAKLYPCHIIIERCREVLGAAHGNVATLVNLNVVHVAELRPAIVADKGNGSLCVLYPQAKQVAIDVCEGIVAYALHTGRDSHSSKIIAVFKSALANGYKALVEADTGYG